MQKLFDLTYQFLIFLSHLTGMSYKEINIVIWFICIPFSWAFLVDKIMDRNYCKIVFTAIVLITLSLNNFSSFSNTLFNTSAQFLRNFDNVGSNYILSSVIICLMLPILIYIVLIKKAYFNTTKL